jgi:polyisoprenyl-phosphate glycosyltransferase
MLVERPPDSTPAPELSIVVPCFNESQGLPRLLDRLRSVLQSIGCTYELLLIDDGSHDGTAQVIESLAQHDPTVRGIIFSRNFGHQAALSAGYDHSRGRAVIVMDADLQHPPELIPEFVAQWRAGNDVVYAFRRNTAPRFGYRLYNWLCNVRIPHESADFRLMDRVVVDALRRMPERNRFVRGLVAWLGFRQIGVPYEQPGRQAGVAAYTPRQRLNLRIDSVFSFSTVPLRMSVHLGLIALALAMLYAIYILVVLVLQGRDHVVSGWPALIITVLVLGGVQLVCLGMVAEYIGRIYDEVKQRPLYVVRELFGSALPAAEPAPDAPLGRDSHLGP